METADDENYFNASIFSLFFLMDLMVFSSMKKLKEKLNNYAICDRHRERLHSSALIWISCARLYKHFDGLWRKTGSIKLSNQTSPFTIKMFGKSDFVSALGALHYIIACDLARVTFFSIVFLSLSIKLRQCSSFLFLCSFLLSRVSFFSGT